MTFFLLNLKQKSIFFPEEIRFLVLKKRDFTDFLFATSEDYDCSYSKRNLPLMELPVNIIKCNESGLEQGKYQYDTHFVILPT